LKSETIIGSIAGMKATFEHMLALGFNLEKTPLLSAAASIESPIAGKKIVFTGKMAQGSREEMQAQARQLGAQVQSAVSSVTDILVCGEKVGQTKLDKASQLGIHILSEKGYYALIGSGDSEE
jgi:DNA ligase (NAD+)